MNLQLNDRVSHTWKGEKRYGTVVEVYDSKPDLTTHRSYVMLGVRWDGTTEVDRGYLAMSGSLHKETT